MVDWKVIPSFASPITRLDEQSLGICAGDHSSQQTTECLNLLVAPRSWTEHVDNRACVPRDTLPPDTYAVSFFVWEGEHGRERVDEREQLQFLAPIFLKQLNGCSF